MKVVQVVSCCGNVPPTTLFSICHREKKYPLWDALVICFCQFPSNPSPLLPYSCTRCSSASLTLFIYLFFSLKLFFLILFLSFLSFTFVCPWPRMGWRMMHLPLRPSKDYWSGSKAQSCAEVKQWCIRVSLVVTNILHACIQADYELYQA